MNRLYRKEIKEFFSVLLTNHVTKLEKPDDSEFGNDRHPVLLYLAEMSFVLHKVS